MIMVTNMAAFVSKSDHTTTHTVALQICSISGVPNLWPAWPKVARQASRSDPRPINKENEICIEFF